MEILYIWMGISFKMRHFLFILAAISFAVLQGYAKPENVVLSSSEQSWLKQHASQIRFAPNPTWPPAEFVDDSGNYRGIAAEYIERIENQLGIKFQRVEFKTWAEILNALEQGKVDFVAGIHKNAEREQFLEFTGTYLEAPVVVLCRNDFYDKYHSGDLRGLRLACTEGYASINHVIANFPDAQIITTPTDLSALLMASLGNVDGAIVDILTASYLAQKYGITHLALATETGFNWEIGMAVRKEYAPLAGIIDKVLSSISEEEKESIYEKWVNVKMPDIEDYKTIRLQRILWISLAVLAVLVGLGAVISVSLRREVARKTAALRVANKQLEALLESLQREIQEKNHVADLLEQNARKLSDIFNAVSDGILIIELQNKTITECNARAAELLCFISPDFLLNKNISDLPLSDRGLTEEHLFELMNNTLKTGESHTTIHSTCMNGRDLRLALNLRKIVLRKSESILVVIRDVTESYHYEEQLRLAMEEAQRNDRLKSAFLRNISHEFRTPMNGILGFANLLKDREMREKYLDEFLDRIEKSGNRFLNLIDEMVEISKLESGEVSMVFEKIDLKEFLEEMRIEFMPEAQAKGLFLIVKEDVRCQEVECYADRTVLKSILKHIIRNAIKYSSQGIIELGYYRKMEETEIYIKDQGIGIPPDKLESVLNLFEQADPEDMDVREGIGLGLSIARKFSHLLGGQIWIESKEHQGTIVYLSIPDQRLD
ncbi:MAG: transporter substrate-binding domain-containing protein [Bacteroidales bacterium]